MRKEGPKFTRENYPVWCGKMKLYLIGMGNQCWNDVVTKYNAPKKTLCVDDLKENKIAHYNYGSHC